MKRVPITEDVLAFVKEESVKCIGCRACMKGCPMLSEYCDNPKELLGRLSQDGSFSGEMPYTCMLCGYCAQACPKEVSFRDVFFAFRQCAVREYKGTLPRELNTGGVRLHQKLSDSPLISGQIKAAETLFFPGCALLAQGPDVTIRTYAYLKESIPDLGFTNRCCFKPTEYLGDETAFAAYAEKLYADLRKAGVKTLLTACSNCYMSFRRHLPEMQIRSVYEVLAKTGIPEEKKNVFAGRTSVYFHDPCPTRSETELQEAVRTLAKQMGLIPEELEFNRTRTLCCGTGGMIRQTAPAIHKKHKSRRAEEGGPGQYLTYCRECADTMTEAGRPALHILDLLFSDGMISPPSGLMRGWTNRIRSRKTGAGRA